MSANGFISRKILGLLLPVGDFSSKLYFFDALLGIIQEKIKLCET